MKILPQSDSMGSQVRHLHQSGLPRPSWFPKRVEPFWLSQVRQHAQCPMGLANAQCSLDYIQIIAEFILQPQYQDVVTMFGITNEPQEAVVGLDQLSR